MLICAAAAVSAVMKSTDAVRTLHVLSRRVAIV
jgi:hypothetical protein